MRRKRNKRLIVVLLVFIIALGGGGYVLTQFSDEEKDYSSEDSEASEQAISKSLTCEIPHAVVLDSSHEISFKTNGAYLGLGFSNQIGGVGTEMYIGKDKFSSFNILEGRSGAGAGQQFTQMNTTYQNESVLINQGAGNATGNQWGYKANLVKNTESSIISGFFLNTSDTVEKDSNTYGTTPCQTYSQDNPYSTLSAGKMEVNLEKDFATDAIVFEKKYTLRFLDDQSWRLHIPTNALYMKRRVAKKQNMKMYIGIHDKKEIGPIELGSKDISFPEHALLEEVYQAGLDSSVLIIEKCKYVLFLWDSKEGRIGLLVKEPRLGSQIRFDRKAYCNDDSVNCGSLAYIYNNGMFENITFEEGDEVDYLFRYYVGFEEDLYRIVRSEEECVSACGDKECGDDGCGGSCGTCTADESCVSGKCISEESVNMDFDGNGKIDGKDYGIILGDWADYYDNNKLNNRSDLNGNGKIDGSDYTLFLQGWSDYFDNR